MKLSYTSIAGGVFCDYLNVTLPASVKSDLLFQLSAFIDTAGLSSYDDGETYQLQGSSGALKLKSNSRYLTLSASGAMLRHFRDLGIYDYYLQIISMYEHKVTLLDATADFYVTYAPSVVQDFKNAAIASEIVLTRKNLPSTACKWLFSPNEHGYETGTVYLGKRDTHSVQAKIYDKGHELRSKGVNELSQIVRVEISCKSDTGVSLRDAHNPENLFYNYTHRSIVTPPPHFVGWDPLHIAYALPVQKELFEPAGKILNIFKFSNDVARAFRLALEHFPNEALSVLQVQLRTAYLLRHCPIV